MFRDKRQQTEDDDEAEEKLCEFNILPGLSHLRFEVGRR